MSQFSLDELTLSRPDTWELLGDPTENLVAEAAVKTCDRNMWTPEGKHAELPLDQLVESLSDWQQLSTATALARIANAIEAKEVLCWLGEDEYMICVNHYETLRIKARWAFTTLFRWAEEGTTAANKLLRSDGLHDAIAIYEADFPGRSVVLPLAKHVGLTHEQAFTLLNSDGWNDDIVSRLVRKYGSADDAVRTKRRMAMRVIDYLRIARRRHQTLDS